MNGNFYKRMEPGRSFFRMLLITVLLCGPFSGSTLYAQVTVTGTVTDASDGSPLPGVNVYIKDTQNGTITDGNGAYSISASNDAVVIFSYIGFTTQEIAVNGRSSIDVPLQPNAETLGEVVVTALGIKRDERSLGYAVGKVDGSELNRVGQENVLGSLAGRVPGVSIMSTGGVGSSVSMVIRGMTSLSSDNQPLFVVDGVPLANSLNNVTRIGRDNNVDYGNAISDINPDNIESLTVLKGPSAAALYGSRAGNGVVIITTKSGSNAKKLTVSLSSNNTFDIPFKFLDFHSKHATGIRPYTPDNNPYDEGVLMIEEGSAAAIGPRLDQGYRAVQWNSPLDENGNPIPTELVSHPDNVKNFVRTGITSTNSISVANSSDLITYRIGYTNMANRGIIPNSDLERNSLDLSTSLKLHSKLTASTNVNVSRNSSNNRPSGNRGTNPLQAAYYVSPHIDIRDLKEYWVKGQEGLQQRSQAIGDYNNPYFLANEVNNSFVRDRAYGNIKLDWQITPVFSLMGRYAVDTYNEQRETKIAPSYTNEPRGAYGVLNMKRFERNADFLATFKKDIGDFNLTVSAGGNMMRRQWSDVLTASKDGTGLITPGVYTIQNIAPANLNYSNYRSTKAIYSVYGLVNLGYRDMIYLDLTARNDWSSTLPAANRSYFYPSASLSVLINEMVNISRQLDLLKIRVGIAQVGNDTDPYQLLNIMDNNGAWDGITRLSKSPTVLTPDLKPEQAVSYELGLDVGLFNNRIRFEGTYYTVDNENQIIVTKLPPSSGYTSKKINAGLLSSRGWELALTGVPIRKNDLQVEVGMNYTWNRTTIEKLSDGLPFFTLWTDAKGGAWTYVGEEMGDIYDAELVRVEDKESPYYGYPILDENGSWQSVSAANTRIKIGNFNPDFIMGFNSTITYKAFSLSILVDWRNGGDFVSQTYRYGESDLRTQRWLDQLINPGDLSGDQLRDWLVANAGQHITDGFNIVGGPGDEYGGYPFEYGVTLNDGVFNPGVIAQYDDNGNIAGYTENLGGEGTKIIPYADNYPWDFTKASLFDASFVKLREVTLGYQLPSSLIRTLGLQSASFSLYARNIMLWTKAKIGIDPENAFQPDSGVQGSGIQFKQGIERYNVNPWTISTGFKLNLTF